MIPAFFNFPPGCRMRPGITFSGADVRPAGHIFFIPPADRPGDDPKTRPHFLLNRFDPSADPYGLATLAHMSSKATELNEFACPGHEIMDPGATKGTARGGSFVVSARLLPREPEELTRSAYSATGEVNSVRRSVRQALGPEEGLAHPAAEAFVDVSCTCSMDGRIFASVAWLPRMGTAPSEGIR